jgi:hypothetical protein
MKLSNSSDIVFSRELSKPDGPIELQKLASGQGRMDGENAQTRVEMRRNAQTGSLYEHPSAGAGDSFEIKSV